KWNGWLLDEVVKLCKQEVIPEFKSHPKWKFQILSTFEFSKSVGSESYDRLFGPKLIQPLERFIDEDECIPTRNDCWVRPNRAVIADEDGEALKALVALGVLAEDEIAPTFGGQADLKFAHTLVQNRTKVPIRSVSRWQLFKNSEYLENKAKSAEGAKWFRA